MSLLLLNLGGPLSFAADRPDFVVTSISDPPASALPGESFTLDIVVTNQGLAPAAATDSVKQVVTKFSLVAGTSKKNLKGVDPIPLPVAAGVAVTHSFTVSVYSDTVPGTYTLQACADGDGDVSEALENNNCTNAAAGIVVLQAPDLLISSISNPPSSGGQGQPITVKDTVKNVGPVNADPSVTKYFLVSLVDGTKQDLKLPTPNVPTPLLKPGQTFTEQQIVTIRPETDPGDYQLQACADGAKAEPEQDENNNCTTSTGKITVTAVPDLAVSSVTVQGAPLTAFPGESFSITAVVANLGLAQAKASTMKYVLINTANGTQKNLNGTQTIPSVNGGASVTVQKTVTLYSDTATGTYVVQACADSAKVVAELLESNNCEESTATVTVQGITTSNADLVVTSVTGPPATALPGDTFSVTAVIKNQGTDAAPASTTSFYLINTSTNVKKNLKNGQSVPGLAPGESQGPAAMISVYSDTLPGTYTMQACADGPKSLAEANEANNCTNAPGTLTVLQVPNLIVSSISNPPSKAALDGVFNATNQVKNTGNVQAGASSTKYYLVSAADGTRKDLKGSQSVPALNANQSFSSTQALTVREETVPGTYRLQACADGGKDVTETNEDDNCFTSSGTIQVTGKPDLIVTSVSVRNAPVTVPRGGGVLITADLKNQGEGDAAAVTLKYVLVNGPGGVSQNLNGTQAVTALRSGASTTYTRTVTVFTSTPLGTYKVQACVDSTDVVSEASELNNCLTTSTTVTVQ